MPCPEPQVLQQLLDETLSIDQQTPVQAHLEGCPTCQKAIERLAAGGVTWDKTAQNLGDQPSPMETALIEAAEKLQDTPISAIQTQAEAPTAPHDDDLSFLLPTQKPGSLGKLDEFEIMSVVGKGGFGIVLKAFDETLHRIVAIKVMAPQLAANGAARARFIREARAAAPINHENVVTIHKVSQDGAKIPYLAMQFVSGQTLNEKIDKAGALNVKEILRIGMQIADGLAAAHKQGLVHRDIKPGNILLENGVERVKISDFGLARAADDASVTQSGTVAGTPMYMSPEQANGEQIDHRSDLFSLGSVLYVMCTGRPPFRATSTMAVMKRVCDDTPAPVQQVNSDIPGWLGNIIAKLHAKRPSERFQSAKEVAELLGQRLADAQAGSELGRAEDRKVPGEAPGTETTRPLTGLGSPWRRRRWKWAAALFLVATTIALWWAFQREWIGLITSTGRVQFSWDDPDLQEIIFKEADGSVAYVVQRGINELEIKTGDFTLEAKVKNDRQPREWSFHRQRFFSREPDTTSQATLPLSLARGERIEIRVALTPARGQPVSEPGWVQLFNGKNIDDWKTHPDQPGKWEVKDGVLVGSGQLSHLFKKIDVDRFHLRARVQISDGGTGAIIFRVPEMAFTEHQVAIGHMVGINSNNKVPMMTGALTILSEPRALKLATLPPPRPGEWFTLEIISDGGVTETRVNGKQTVFDIETIKRPPGRYIALQCTEHPILFKSVEIKELPPSDPGWVQLFNGKDLKGWKKHPEKPGNWRVEDNVLIGAAPLSHLFSERGDYENFHLRAQVKIKGGNSGILFRSKFAYDYEVPVGPRGIKLPSGFEVDLASASDGGAIPTGSVIQLDSSFAFHKAQTKSPADDTWFTVEIIARGKHVVTKINDKTATDIELPASAEKKGHLALQVFAPNTVVEFKKIEIKELPSEGPGKFALAFDGNGRVNIPTLTLDRMGPVTLEGYVTPEKFDHLAHLFGTHDHGVVLWYDWGFAWMIGGAARAIRKEPREPYVPNRRVHLAGVYANGQMRLFVDGRLQAERTEKVTDNAGILGDIWLGSAFRGEMQEVRISKVARYDKDFTPKPRFVSDGDTLALYHFDEGAGDVVKDSSGNNHHGKILGAKWVKVNMPIPALEPGWGQLFNRKDLTGWKLHPDRGKDWRVEQGVLVGRGPGAYLFTERSDYKDFHIRAEAKINDAASGGLWVRSGFEPRPPAPGEKPDQPLGYAANIATFADAKTGALWYPEEGGKWGGIPAPNSPARPDEWFTLDVIVRGNHIVVLVNGEKTADYTDPNHTCPLGHVALQANGPNAVVQFRKIEIKELPLPTEPGWVKLFNGKDLEGWYLGDKKSWPGTWSVEDGLLVGRDRAMLAAKRPYSDFHCRITAKFNAAGDGALAFRGRPNDTARITIGTKPNENTGALGHNSTKDELVKRVEQALVPPETWFVLDVIVRGKFVTAKVNGTTTVDTMLAKMLDNGTLRLDTRVPGSVLHIKSIEIKELPPEEPSWEKLFNGKDLTGWTETTGKQVWSIEEGALIAPKGFSELVATRKDFRDFHLRMEVLADVRTNASLNVRSKGTHQTGYIINLGGYMGNVFAPGSVERMTKNGRVMNPKGPRPKADEWYTLEVIARSNRLIIKLDGNEVVNWEDADAIYTGAISFHRRSEVGGLRIRKMEIMELPHTELGWVRLFNGKDLTDWTDILPVNKAWKIDQGILEATGKLTNLVSKRSDFRDFHLRMEMMSNAETRAGLMLRSDANGSNGYRMELGIARTQRTPGTIVRDLPVKRGRSASDGLVEPGEWFTLEVIAQGNRFIVKQNGKDALNWIDDKWVEERGAIAIFQEDGCKGLKIRKLEIKELSPPKRVEHEILDFAEIHDVDEKSFDAWIDTMKKRNYRLADVAVVTHDKTPRYTAVAVQELKPRAWELVRLTEDNAATQKRLRALLDRKQTVVAQAMYNQGGAIHRILVFVDVEDRATVGVWNGDAKYIGERLSEASERMERPTARCACLDRGIPRFAVVVEPESHAPWNETFNQTLPEFKQWLEKHDANGWRLQSIHAYRLPGTTRFGGIIVKDSKTPEWEVTWSLLPPHYEQEILERKRRGFRPQFVIPHYEANTLHFSVVWTRFRDLSTVPPGQVDGWGAWIDPKSACKHEIKAGTLTIDIPKGEYNLASKFGHNGYPSEFKGNQDAPRFLQDVEGDFVMQVKLPDFPQADHSGSVPPLALGIRGAGLVLWGDDRNFVKFLGYQAGSGNPKFGRPTNQMWCFAGPKLVEDRVIHALGVPYLQIERQGESLFFRTSSDGKKWEDFGANPFSKWTMPKSLKVGVVAINQTSQPFTAVFADFKLTPR